MKIYYGIPDEPLSNAAVAIGVFDGVHVGHQTVLRGACGHQGLIPVALTFDINPMRLVAPDRAPGSISSLNERIKLMELYGGGLHAVVVAQFNREFAALSPDDFVKHILIDHLGASHIYIGPDFRYGHNRLGTIETLVAEGGRFGFRVTVVPSVTLQGERVASSRIRNTIAAGDIELAREMLGHEFLLSGIVVRGKQLGRKLGFPTANILVEVITQILPADGIYGGYAMLPGDSRIIRAAISVGTNPTTDFDGVRKVEAHLMDGFDETIYDLRLELDIRFRLRGQFAFTNLEDLREQIQNDVERIAGILPLLP